MDFYAIVLNIKKFMRFFGIDQEVFFTLLFRGWSVVSGVLMMFCIPLWLGPKEQGYYYTFSSLLALQVFFELGLNQVIMHVVSHDYAHLKLATNGTKYEGDALHLNRIASIIGMVRRWYAIAAFLFAIGVGSAGAAFFVSHASLPVMSWLVAWLFLTLATSANLYLSAMLTVLEGCGQIAHVARMRLNQSLIGYLLMWSVFSLGGGLWAAPIVPMVAAVYTMWWISHRVTLKILGQSSVGATGFRKVCWRMEIFPMQWRIAISWISGYFIFQLFVPLVFAKHGAVEAGRFGITLSVFNAILAVAVSWINAKNPKMSVLIASGERDQLNAMFKTVLTGSIGISVLGTAVFIGMLSLGMWLKFPMVYRFVHIDVAVCIAVTTIATVLIHAAAAYMRAHKEEPMLWVSLVTGLATAIAVWVGVNISTFFMMASYAFITLAIALPWTLGLFFGYYRRGK